MLTELEKLAVASYLESNRLGVPAQKLGVSEQYVLHAVAKCMRRKRAELERIHNCEKCEFRSGDRPCVMPEGVCHFKTWRK